VGTQSGALGIGEIIELQPGVGGAGEVQLPVIATEPSIFTRSDPVSLAH